MGGTDHRGEFRRSEQREGDPGCMSGQRECAGGIVCDSGEGSMGRRSQAYQRRSRTVSGCQKEQVEVPLSSPLLRQYVSSPLLHIRPRLQSKVNEARWTLGLLTARGICTLFSVYLCHVWTRLILWPIATCGHNCPRRTKVPWTWYDARVGDAFPEGNICVFSSFCAQVPNSMVINLRRVWKARQT